jgi:hypothetical protein
MQRDHVVTGLAGLNGGYAGYEGYGLTPGVKDILSRLGL